MQKKSEEYEYGRVLRNPTTIKMLAAQIISASDMYITNRMPERHFKELIIYYASQHGKKLFSYSVRGDLNPTLINRIGKKRAELVKIMLLGYQFRLI